MTESVGETPQPPLAAQPIAKKNAFQRLAGVLFAPAETFEDIVRKPDYLLPLILILLIGVASSVVLVPKLDFETMMREQMAAQNREMSPEDMERVMKFATASGKVMTYAGPIFSIVILLIIAGVLLLAFRLMGGEGTFGQAFSVTLWSWMPLVVFSIVLTIIIATRESISPDLIPTIVRSNPGFLVDPKSQRVLYSLLTSIDLFVIWTLVLLSIGFSYVARVSKGKAAAIVISLWLVLVVFKLGFAALGAAKAKAA